MFALRVEYLTGVSVSQQHDDRSSAEWPPHPARLFFALASAFFETGEDPEEEAFLNWLERQEPPALAVTEATRRSVVVHYVPVNDVRAGRGTGRAARAPGPEELSVLPEYRKRQPRTFPAALPLDPVVHFIWLRAELPPELRAAARRLLAKVTYLGHSASLVCVHPEPNPPPPTLLPCEGTPSSGDLQVLRVCFPGQLTELRRVHHRYLASGNRGPLPCRMQAYRPVRDDEENRRRVPVAPVFGDMVIFRRTSGPVLPILAGFQAVEALRGAVLSACSEPIPEELSGHGPDGRPSERPHVAFVALPDVAHRHADGHVVGLAAVLPAGLVGAVRLKVLRAIGDVSRLVMGATGEWEVKRVPPGIGDGPLALREATWRQSARRWATVTPIVLDRYPDEPFGPEAERIVAQSCERVGLPHPAFVFLSAYSVLRGVPPAHAFYRVRPRSRDARPVVHAVIEFPYPVPGPVLLGAGRYRGWGLCRPLR